MEFVVADAPVIADPMGVLEIDEPVLRKAFRPKHLDVGVVGRRVRSAVVEPYPVPVRPVV